MKYLKMLGLAAVSAMAFMVFASTASATTLETVGGSTINSSVTITASLSSGTSALLKDTDNISQNTCTTSHAHGSTASPFTDPNHISGPLTGHTAENPENGLSFSNCTRLVTVHDPGTLTIKHISGTTGGTVESTEATVTVRVPLIGYVTCETHDKTHIGTLVAASSSTTHAVLSINAVLDCGAIPSAKWEANYTVTTPTGLGVSA